jgi:hypothetical protein
MLRAITSARQAPHLFEPYFNLPLLSEPVNDLLGKCGLLWCPVDVTLLAVQAADSDHWARLTGIAIHSTPPQ